MVAKQLYQTLHNHFFLSKYTYTREILLSIYILIQLESQHRECLTMQSMFTLCFPLTPENMPMFISFLSSSSFVRLQKLSSVDVKFG